MKLIGCIAAAMLLAAAASGAIGSRGNAGPVTITILYDNYGHTAGLPADHGFACLIRGLEKTILFDTGARGDLLLANMAALDIDPASIQIVVLSHGHGDHTGGLQAFLKANPAVTVYGPASLGAKLTAGAAAMGARAVLAADPTAICAGASTLGEMDGGVKEQAVALDLPGGLVVVTGCAHPGIVRILARARERHHKDIDLVLGGFHLGDRSAAELREILAGFRKLGVRRAGPSHCTGDRAIAAFKAAFGDRFVPLGVGRTITVGE